MDERRRTEAAGWESRAWGHADQLDPLPALARFAIWREDLFDACVSQQVGAWVLANCISQFGATWKSVGCYYAGPASKNTAAQVEYVMDVQRFYEGYRRQAQIEQANAATAVVATTAKE